jgi:beta-N-acetylhexosaminidase
MSTDVERLAAASLFPGFVGADRPPDWVLRWAEAGLGGVVLFSRNVGTPEQLRGLTAGLHAAGGGLVVAIDEEGGDVTRLEAATGSSYPGNGALGAIDDVELTRRVASAMGTDLSEAGVDLNLAPVADVNTEPQNPVIGIRSFGSDPSLVARHVAAFVEGLQSAGVAACAKHFPGHGATTVDSHLGLPQVTHGLERLLAEELPPFRAAVRAGVAAIMTAHILVPALDDVPATVSSQILGGLLREELGFDGMVMTDALEMRGLSGTLGVEQGAVRALAAGADALCLGHDLGAESVASVHAAIVAAVHDGRLPEGRLQQAAERVARARTIGAGGQDRRVDRVVGLEAARRALSVEGAAALDRPALVIELWPAPSMAAGPASSGLGDLLSARLPSTTAVHLDDTAADGAELLDAAARHDRQPVLVLRDAHRHEWERETATMLIAAAPEAIVVELGLPLWHPPGTGGYVASRGAGRVNLEAVAEALTGTSSAT